MSSMPDKAHVGRVVLRKVPEVPGENTPEHYLWKQCLEQDWAGEWTLAGLTSYKYKIGLDPSFVEELPEVKRGRLHKYEWILCKNGGIIFLYSEKDMVLRLLTTKKMAEKVLAANLGASVHLTQDDRLSHVIHFPADKIMEVCKLAGARRAKQGRPMTPQQKKATREQLDKVRPTPFMEASRL